MCHSMELQKDVFDLSGDYFRSESYWLMCNIRLQECRSWCHSKICDILVNTLVNLPTYLFPIPKNLCILFQYSIIVYANLFPIFPIPMSLLCLNLYGILAILSAICFHDTVITNLKKV